MNWLHYLAEANLYLIIFYLTYQLLLARETYSQLNRIYLLFSCVAAFVLPMLQLGILKPAEPITVNQTYPVELFYPELNQVAANHITPRVEEYHLTWQDYLIYAYAIGCAILLLALLVKLFVLVRTIRHAKREQRGQYKLIYLSESDVAFSIFNYLFIGTDAVGENTIIRHELVHIHQKHSLDILFVELLKIVNWFNPFIYLLQNSLKTIHEYIADEHTAAYENDTLGYATFLVNNAYGAGGSSITHSFFNYNLLKKRIIMLNQQRSGTSARLKYLITAPVFAGLLCASTLAFSKDYGWIDLDPANVSTRMEMLPALPSASVVRPQDKFVPPPPPMGTADGYNSLSYHLYKTISYRPAKTDKGGMVLINFSVNGSHKITDAKINKSAGKMLDALALNALNTYKLTVNDKVGKNYIARFYFYTTDYSIFNNKVWSDEYKLDLLVTGKPHTYPTTAKGYDYQLYDIYSDDGHKGKFTQHINKVVIFEKNGEAREFTPKSDLRVLRETYGFDWPNNTDQVKFPPPIITPNKKIIDKNKNEDAPADAPVVQKQSTSPIPDTIHLALLNDFVQELARNIKYPAIVRSSNVTGKVFAVFSVDDNGNLQYLKIVRSISNSASEEVFRVIKTSSVIKKMPGNWVVPVNFTLNDEYGTATALSTSLPASELEKKTFEYNPNNITPSDDNQKMLNEIVIRGYVKRAKN